MYALDVAAYILGEGEVRGWSSDLKYERQVVLVDQRGQRHARLRATVFCRTAVCQPPEQAKAAEEILREVYRLRDELVGSGRTGQGEKTKGRRIDFWPANCSTDGLTAWAAICLAAGDPLFDKAYVENIQKVTAEQIRDVARRYFVPQRLNRVIDFPARRDAESGRESGRRGRTKSSPLRR